MPVREGNRLLPQLRLAVSGMAVKGPGWREFSQFMADHVFGYKDRYEFFAVVHRKGLADQFGGNGGSTRPGLDNRFTASGILSSHLFQKTFIDERTLLD